MSGESVFIIENDGIIALHLQEILERGGYRVEEPAISYREAHDRLGRRPRPGLVILDTGIHELPACIAEVRRICVRKTIPVVILTSFADHRNTGPVNAASQEAYLVKPFSERDLLQVVGKALRTMPGT